MELAADAGTGYTCTARGADATSGLASLTYSVDGGAPQAPGPDGTFSVAKGHVVVRATDVAGNGANSVGLILSNRIVPVTTPPRSVSEAVLRSGHGSVISRALGEVALNATAALLAVFVIKPMRRAFILGTEPAAEATMRIQAEVAE